LLINNDKVGMQKLIDRMGAGKLGYDIRGEDAVAKLIHHGQADEVSKLLQDFLK